ncbi:MAG: glycosyltransferase family A protein, partial [Cyanobacteria bacterium J06635_1]
MPSISVVIPAYNSERTIGDTVQSVLAQTFTDFEIIVINDGSQDGTLACLGAIADSRLHVFSYDNAGVAISRNRGIEKAKGEYVAFLDADDLWVPEKLTEQYQALQESPT